MACVDLKKLTMHLGFCAQDRIVPDLLVGPILQLKHNHVQNVNVYLLPGYKLLDTYLELLHIYTAL